MSKTTHLHTLNKKKNNHTYSKPREKNPYYKFHPWRNVNLLVYKLFKVYFRKKSMLFKTLSFYFIL